MYGLLEFLDVVIGLLEFVVISIVTMLLALFIGYSTLDMKRVVASLSIYHMSVVCSVEELGVLSCILIVFAHS